MSGLTRRRMLAAMAGAAATGWLAGCGVPRDAAGEPIVLTWQSPHFRDHPLVGRLYAPDRMVFSIPANLDGLDAAVADKQAGGATRAYLCRGSTCSAPVETLADLVRTLKARVES